MSMTDELRLQNHVQSIVDSIQNGYFTKDNLDVMQDEAADDHQWYIYDYENNEVLDNEWFETEQEAKDYLEKHDGVRVSGFDYLSDVLDINWILNNDLTYKGAKVLVAFGGPNIWINTEMQQVEGYWWMDKCIIPYNRDEIGLDEALEELYNCK